MAGEKPINNFALPSVESGMWWLETVQDFVLKLGMKPNFFTSKNFIGPVHLLPKTDKWDYLWSPIIDLFASCFDIGEVPKSLWKMNWNLFYFLPFIFSFEQCDLLSCQKYFFLTCQWVKMNPNFKSLLSDWLAIKNRVEFTHWKLISV